MGRALLIICLGSFIILGIIQQSVQNRQFTMTEGNIESFMVTHGRNLTGSALEMTINRIIHDSDWDNGQIPLTLDYILEDMNVSVQVDNHDSAPGMVDPNFIMVSSTLLLDNRNITSRAFLRTATLELPEMLGALSVYGPSSKILFKGNNFNVIGYDTNPGDSYRNNYNFERDGGTGDGDDLPAITTNQISKEQLVDGTNLEKHRHYDGAEPAFNDQSALDDTRLMELIAEYKSLGTPYDGNLGDSLNPKITIINDQSLDYDASKKEVRVSGSEYGSGILIIEEGVTLNLRGGNNFRFDGLIIIKGNLDIHGGLSLYGGAIMTDNADTNIDPYFEAGGNPTLYYSSKVLENLENRLGGGSGGGVIVDRILY